MIQWILNKLPRKHKTVIAAAIAIIFSVVEVFAQIGALPPQVTNILMDIKEPVLILATGLGTIGLRHALKKTQDAYEHMGRHR